ncbi:adenosylcobinamide amidohydrolase [Paenibacillus sp. NPDC058071]|uniref:adenosylcobinamide amidohydrolase n=1 Tax=Paenibacillus sp. NPDC058071 TaxID=3346326 RepID=UPI0036D82148
MERQTVSSQPFRSGFRYESLHFPSLRLEFAEGNRIVTESPVPLRTISNAVHMGGAAEADKIVNWKVPLDYSSDDPVLDISERMNEWGCDPARTVGLLTAAKLTHAAVAEEQGDRFSLLCCTTAGTGNGARAGVLRRTYSAYEAGTINIVVLIDGEMTDAAMVNAVLTATEAKAAALQDLKLVDAETGLTATGTTTDAIVVGVSRNGGYGEVHPFAGTATTIGNAIGRLVYETVLEACRTQGDA